MIGAEDRGQRLFSDLCNFFATLVPFVLLNRNETSNQSDITEDKTDKVIFIFIKFHGLSSSVL